MKCTNCGNELSADAKFCGNCGTPVMQTAMDSTEVKETVEDVTKEPVSPTPTKAPNSLAKMPKKVLLGIVAAAVVVIALLIAVFTATPTINMEKYTTVTYSGYDGYGTATLSVDWDQIMSDYKGKIKYTSKAKDEFDAYGTLGDLANAVDPVYEISSFVSYQLDKSSGLSNDDKVKVTWNVDSTLEQYLKCNIKYNNDKEYTVSDLEEIKKVDIFKDIKVTFTGLSGEGYADIDYGDDSLAYYLTVDKSYDLSNGDKITISISDYDIESYAQAYGQLPKESSKTYTVEGLGEYVKKMSEITDDFKSEAEAQANDVLKATAAEYKDYSNISDVSYEYAGDYLEVKKENSSSWYNDNYYGVVYKVTVTATSGETTTLYRVVQFNDILVNDSGECSADLNDYNQVYNDYISIEGTSWTSMNGYESLDSIKNHMDQDAADYTYETSF